MKKLVSVGLIVFLLSISTAYAYDFVDFFNDVSKFFTKTTGMATGTGCCQIYDACVGNVQQAVCTAAYGSWYQDYQCCVIGGYGLCQASCPTTSTTTASTTTIPVFGCCDYGSICMDYTPQNECYPPAIWGGSNTQCCPNGNCQVSCETTSSTSTTTIPFGCCDYGAVCDQYVTQEECYPPATWWGVGTQCCPNGNCAASCDTTTTTMDDCHTSALWSWNYCSPDCKCNAGEGDCDTGADCNTGYCAPDVGANYGQDSTMDVCEVGTTTTVNTTTTTIPFGCCDYGAVCDQYVTQEECYPPATWWGVGTQCCPNGNCAASCPITTTSLPNTTTTINTTTTAVNTTTTTITEKFVYVNVKIGTQIKEMRIKFGENATFSEFTIIPTAFTSLGDWYIKVVKGTSYQEQRILWGSLNYTNFTIAGQNVQVKVTAMSGIDITTTTAPEICTDSDGGKNIHEKGITTGKTTDKATTAQTIADYCVLQKAVSDGGYSYSDHGKDCSGEGCGVLEQFCINENRMSGGQFYSCPYGCKDGACNPTPERVVYVNVKIGSQASEMGIKFGESGAYSGYTITPTAYTSYGYWYIKLEKGSYSQEKEILGGNSVIFNIGGEEVLVTLTAVETNGERKNMDQCIIGRPIITIGPSFQRAIGGERVTYTVTITNNDNYACEPTVFSRGSSWNCDAVTYVTDEYSGRDLPPINPGESLVFEMYVTTRPVESITKGVIEESVQHGRAYVVSFSNNANTTLSVLPPETEKLCNDSDGGLNYFVKGTAYAPGGQGYLDDMCFGYKLSERYCDGNEMKSLTYECLNGCVNGACIKKDVREAVSESEINNIIERLELVKIRFEDMKKRARAIAYYYGSIGDLTNQERYNYIETTLNGAIQRVDDITNLIETNQNNIEPIREQIREAISSLDFYLQWVLSQIG